MTDIRPISKTRNRPPAKYAAGAPIHTTEELDAAVDGREMLWYAGAPKHALWVQNLPYGVLLHRLSHGLIRKARISGRYIHWIKRELQDVGLGEALKR